MVSLDNKLLAIIVILCAHTFLRANGLYLHQNLSKTLSFNNNYFCSQNKLLYYSNRF